jgi:hypothetical protein
VIDFANHLAELASVHGLSASVLRVRRAAVNTTLRQLGHDPLPSSTVIGDVVRGAASHLATNKPSTPQWDLFLVLAYLRDGPFEPLEETSLMFLSYKTLFLITLASCRRVSEVHALSGLPSDVSFERDGSLALRFLPEFLAKNQVPGDPSPVIAVPSLTKVLGDDDPDRLNCPVRALKVYRSRTEGNRSKTQRRLFISLNTGYSQDIQKPTLARWIEAVVKGAYQWASSSRSRAGLHYIDMSSARSHEVRAWSSTLAASSGVPIKQLLQAAYWRSEDIFINHYLRDYARVRGDGQSGIGSCVAAQTVISGHRAFHAST